MEKHYLGELCPLGHEFENTGKTLRRKRRIGEPGYDCLKCNALHSDKSRKKPVTDGDPSRTTKHFDLENNDQIFCRYCDFEHIWGMKPISYQAGGEGHKFYCPKCKGYFNWRYGYPEGRRPLKGAHFLPKK